MIPLRSCSNCDRWSEYSRTTDKGTGTVHSNCTLHQALKRGSDTCSKWQKKQPAPVYSDADFCC